MTVPTISTPGAIPDRSSDTPAEFSSNADVFVDWLGATLPAELNAFAPALIAEASVANYSATSTTSMSLTIGTKSFTVETGKMFVAGQYVLIADAAAPTINSMWGQVVSYNFDTGAMVVSIAAVEDIDGTGTKTAWIIGLTGPKGSTGDPDNGVADIQDFTASGTWTKPDNVTVIRVIAFGAGGGGASGRQGAAASARYGGSGGGGGAIKIRDFIATDLTDTVAIAIGAGGTGGASQASADSNGNDGSDGGDTTFGAYVSAYGGEGGNAGNAAGAIGGNGGSTVSIGGDQGLGAAFEGGWSSDYLTVYGGGRGGDSGSALLKGGPSVFGGGGGGAGGYITAGDAVTAASAGGLGKSDVAADGGGGAAGGTGAAGSAGSDYCGGGGGGASKTANAGAGGDGGIAAGGGGGGASLNTFASGAGGDGGDGFVRVISW